METVALTPAQTGVLEATETAAWIDMYAAAPADYAAQYGLSVRRIGDVVLLGCRAIPFPHFNCAFGLGLSAPASEAEVAAVLSAFRDSPSFYIHLTPYSRPDALPRWLQEQGLKVRSSWDRIWLDLQRLVPETTPAAADGAVSPVTDETGDEWTHFITTTYGGLPTRPWLKALVGRPGWHHYALREEDRIVAARSMYLSPEGRAWLGVEAPVPGIMGPVWEADLRINRRIVADAATMGARHIIADIEAPAAAMDTPAYINFASLGFKRCYLRQNYGL